MKNLKNVGRIGNPARPAPGGCQDKAMKLGCEYRESQRSHAGESEEI
jgi:hypothetical protein